MFFFTGKGDVCAILYQAFPELLLKLSAVLPRVLASRTSPEAALCSLALCNTGSAQHFQW